MKNYLQIRENLSSEKQEKLKATTIRSKRKCVIVHRHNYSEFSVFFGIFGGIFPLINKNNRGPQHINTNSTHLIHFFPTPFELFFIQKKFRTKTGQFCFYFVMKYYYAEL